MISILGQPLYPIGFTNEATVPSSNTPQDEALNLKEQKVENLVCSLCSSSCHNDLMLKCHLCKQGYHNFCLIPQPFQMPADLSTWKCISLHFLLNLSLLNLTSSPWLASFLCISHLARGPLTVCLLILLSGGSHVFSLLVVCCTQRQHLSRTVRWQFWLC